MQTGSIEIRTLQHSGWWDAQLFVLKQSNEKWSADFREITYFEETGKVKKQTKTKIGEPKSGWEVLWNKLEGGKNSDSAKRF